MPNMNQSALVNTFEGFDTARQQDSKKSAKDAFLELSQRAPRAPIEDKSQLGDWFNVNIRPGMESLGHHVTDVQGDKMRFNNWQGDFWVDYGRGAGAPGGALAWQAEDANAPAPSATAGRQGQRIGALGSPLMESILASLQQQQQPVDPQALLLETMR
jgi:hypothetical protein